MKKGILILFCCAILTACSDIIMEEISIDDGSTENVVMEEENTEPQDIETVEIASIVDGDTIKVYLDGERYTIRMVGIDTPESVHPDPEKNTVYGQKASEYAKQIFKQRYFR